MKIRKAVGIALLTMVFGLAWNGTAQAAPIPEEELIIADGVYVEGISVGGMTIAEAQEAIDAYMAGLEQQILSVEAEENVAQISLSELDISLNTTVDAAREAALVGRGGNVLKRYKEVESLKREDVVVDLSISVDKEKLSQFVTEEVEIFNREPKEPSVTRKNSKFVITDSQNGITVKVEETKQAIIDALHEYWEGPVTAMAAMDLLAPEHTGEELEVIQDRLGTAMTLIANVANLPRLHNVTLASKKANGTIVYPGEEASFSAILGPRNKENGWALAAEYAEGGSVDDYGGGICQTATTLYLALLDAEVTVTERKPHSRIVWYSDYSKDAAMAGNYKDLKFRNDFDYPIYLEAYVSGNQITYTIYGKETRPSNRRVEYVSKTLLEEESGWVEEYRDDLPAGVIQEGGSSYPKVVSELWKKVYVDGKLVSNDRVSHDTYKPLAGTRYIGTGKAVEGSTGTEGGTESSGAATTPEGSGSGSTGEGTGSGSGTGETGEGSGTGTGGGGTGESSGSGEGITTP